MATIHDVWIPAHRIIRAARKRINQALRPLGITSAEGNILFHLAIVREPVSQERLVDDLDISKAAISRVVDSLERKGYVLRRKDTQDRRSYRLLLTDKAQGLREGLQEAYDQVYDMAAEIASPEALDELIVLLTRIADAFDAGV